MPTPFFVAYTTTARSRRGCGTANLIQRGTTGQPPERAEAGLRDLNNCTTQAASMSLGLKYERMKLLACMSGHFGPSLALLYISYKLEQEEGTNGTPTSDRIDDKTGMRGLML